MIRACVIVGEEEPGQTDDAALRQEGQDEAGGGGGGLLRPHRRLARHAAEGAHRRGQVHHEGRPRNVSRGEITPSSGEFPYFACIDLKSDTKCIRGNETQNL